MDESAVRRRLRDAPTHSTARHMRNKSSALAAQSMTPPATASSKATTSEHGRTSSQHSRKEEDGTKARHFIGNVGAGGTLYLAPSRLPHQVNIFPATPPASSHGLQQSTRQATASGNWTPRLRGDVLNANVPVPPVSLGNATRRRRTRSHSASTIGESHARGVSANEPGNIADGDSGLLNLRIPHYRLGTPRFSDRGTAYLHNSIYTESTDDRSSVLSQQAYDRLFPMPPSKTMSQQSTLVHHLHPSAASRTRERSPAVPDTGLPSTAVFDKLDKNPNDPASVRFASNGQILAATIPRLIVQITSPRFLDYELLSDFFLTYRGFLTSQELLDWLLTRMRWAIANVSDAGRIVRVRTFVAMRHWILNYFADDFASSLELRQSFCDNVNKLTYELKGKGVGDLNIIAELKKCWRRTSALYWPTPDALASAAVDEITPGPDHGEVSTPEIMLAKSTRQGLLGESNQAAITSLQLVAFDQRTNQRARVVSMNNVGSAMLMRRGSIPASPMSEDSLQILSCSIPFLQRVRPGSQAEKRAQRNAPRPVMQRQNSLTRRREKPDSSNIHEHTHRRSESDSVILRRTPEDRTLDEIPSITLTGGLIRGLLLQPCPSALQNNAPRTPPAELGAAQEDFFDDGNSHHGSVKRLVGDVRRALSVKKNSGESSGRSNNSTSSGSRGSNNLRDALRSVPSDATTSSTAPLPKHDVLAAKVQKSYQTHFIEPETTTGAQQTDYLSARQNTSGHPGEFATRLASGITTGSRSIVIVDATSLPAVAPVSSGPTDHFAAVPLFPGISDVRSSSTNQDSYGSTSLVRQSSEPTSTSGRVSNSIDGQLHGSFVFPSSASKLPEGQQASLRKSSGVHGDRIQSHLSPKLRRRPGGDLKAADHVHELQPKDDLPSPTQSLATVTNTSRSYSYIEHRPGMSHTASGKTVRSKPSDRSSSQPHVRSSFRSDASRLAKVRSGSEGGGIEDALAKLEGKPGTRRRHSGMSWLELPTNDEAGESQTNLVDGADFEIINPGAHGQIYHVSAADMSEDASLTESFQTGAKPIATYVPTRGEHNTETSRASSLPHDATFVVGSDPNIHRRDAASTVISMKSSFLLDDNQSLSDISTDIAEDHEDDSVGVRSFFFDEASDHDSVPRPRALFSASISGREQPTDVKQQVPIKIATSAAKILGVPAGSLMTEVMQNRRRKRTQDDLNHFPFVLAFKSDVIAEQMCIIEKDALDEVDWKDLISLYWRHRPSTIRNWADYLKLEDSNGIDLVVARFNLVVKWVVSQVVLTDSMLERARCITKYIHIAMHCLRLRNYASMAQITLALLSSDLARLQKTWSLVSPSDKRALDRLEMLCQPLRNFQNLRAEMESSSLVDGGIPFIGLYTHDLMYNAQKPALLEPIPADEGSAPLVNFDRYQTAATITKSLLRLLDASARYVFRPHPEALSRCLWLAALEDADISEISMELE